MASTSALAIQAGVVPLVVILSAMASSQATAGVMEFALHQTNVSVSEAGKERIARRQSVGARITQRAHAQITEGVQVTSVSVLKGGLVRLVLHQNVPVRTVAHALRQERALVQPTILGRHAVSPNVTAILVQVALAVETENVPSLVPAIVWWDGRDPNVTNQSVQSVVENASLLAYARMPTIESLSGLEVN